MILRKEIECVLRAILYPSSQISLVCTCDEKAEKCFEELKLLINAYSNILNPEIRLIEDKAIYFKNGSKINVIQPSSEEDVIRGKRADFRHWMFDYESASISNEDFEEAIKPYIKKED